MRLNIDEIMTLYVLVRNEYEKYIEMNSDYGDMLYNLLKKLVSLVEDHDKFEFKDGDVKYEKE